MEWQAPTLLQRSTLHLYAVVVQLVIACNIFLGIAYQSPTGMHEASRGGSLCQLLDEDITAPEGKSYECVTFNGLSVGNVIKSLALIGGSAAIFPDTVDFLNRWFFRLQAEEEGQNKELRCGPTTGNCCRLRITDALIKAFALSFSIGIVLTEQTLRMLMELR